TFALGDNCGAATNTVAQYLNVRNIGRAPHTYMFRKLLRNEGFRRRFVSRLADLVNTTLSTENVVGKINTLAAQIRPSIPIETKRWRRTPRQWEANIEVMRRFAEGRPEHFLRNVARAIKGVGGVYTLKIGAAEGGSVRVNTIDVAGPWTGRYFHGVPVTLKALPKPGHRFKGWAPASLPQEEEITLEPPPAKDLYLVAPGSEWKYRDAATAPPDDWYDRTFDDAEWPAGPALLGYGDNDIKTQLESGSFLMKTPTYYFRRAFEIDAPGGADLKAGMIVDDGAVVYVNGSEAFRIGMPPGEIGFRTKAAQSVGGADETTWKSFSVPPGMLRKGRNVIAVEVHQVTVVSSDIRFDLSLRFDAPAVEATPVFEKGRKEY
ncbi:MAG: CotH kinase family protein, partial [Planctomycetota bacterium]